MPSARQSVAGWTFSIRAASRAAVASPMSRGLPPKLASRHKDIRQEFERGFVGMSRESVTIEALGRTPCAGSGHPRNHANQSSLLSAVLRTRASRLVAPRHRARAGTAGRAMASAEPRHIDAGLVIEGQDRGAVVQQIFGYYEYEWVWAIHAADLPKLDAALGVTSDRLEARRKNSAATMLRSSALFSRQMSSVTKVGAGPAIEGSRACS
jgi:hypothetical protein